MPERGRTNAVLRALREGRTSVGVNVQTNSPELVEMVGLAGYDHVMIDWEHGSFGTDAVVSMIRAAEAVNLTSLVRVPANDEVWIKRVLDAGALGIVVPHVATPGQARAAVSAARYTRSRGQGARGACPSVRAAGHLTTHWQDFAQWSDKNVFVAVAVESQEGVDALEQILAVEGIDALFLGTFDLAHEMGHFGDNGAPEVTRQIDRMVEVARKASVPLFATLYRGSTLEDTRQDYDRWIEAGARVVNAVSDRRLVLQSLGARISMLRDDRE